jgi:hypothetical protein
MRVQFTRPHQGGSMAGSGNDVQVIDLPDGSAIPAGGAQVDEMTPVQDWTWERAQNAGRGLKGYIAALGGVN